MRIKALVWRVLNVRITTANAAHEDYAADHPIFRMWRQACKELCLGRHPDSVKMHAFGDSTASQRRAAQVATLGGKFGPALGKQILQWIGAATNVHWSSAAVVTF